MDDGLAYLRDELMPNLSEIQGWVGLSLMADRSTGRCIATTSWESEEALHASRGRVQQMREGMARRLGGRAERVEEWEIAVMHRDHPAGNDACTRCTWVQVDPAQVDLFKMEVLPQSEMLDGFCSASLFIDRDSGRAVGATVWENRQAMDDSREQTNQIRATATQRVGANVLEVGEFDLAFAHLRVPEMA
jgi:heme-degrading monooxygenase HmoA